MKTTPNSRRLFVKVTSDQIHKRKHLPIGYEGKEIEIMDDLNPNQWSVEEAIIESVPDRCTFFKKGDRVLLDFAVFTEGLYPEMQLSTQTRVIESNAEYTILWAYWGADETSITEVHAKVEYYRLGSTINYKYATESAYDSEISRIVFDEFTFSEKPIYLNKGIAKGLYLVPYPDTIIIPQPVKPKESFEKKGLLYIPNDPVQSRDDVFKEKILFSNVEGLEPGQEVWIKGGESIPIDTRDWKVEYVHKSSIVAID